jgi:Flp pilus assembly protein TadG
MMNAQPWTNRAKKNVVQRLHQSQEGQDIIEYALILPFLLLLTFSIIEGGWLIFRYNTVANAAREGARAGIIPVSAACSQTCVQARVTTAVNRLTTGLDPGRMTVPAPVFTGATVQVTVNYNADLLTGFVIQALGGDNTIPLTATAIMQRE